jgi:hypothetical protein
MDTSNLIRSSDAQVLSMIGGAAQGGSAKPKQERDKIDQERGEEPQDGTPAGAGGVGNDSASKGSVGGNSNDSRTDQDRASDA